MTPLAHQRISGFTLVELVIVVAIGAITLALALPSFNDALVRNRLAGQANDLMAGVNLARTAAIELNTGGGICAANAGQNGCGGSWDNGWIVWADSNRNNNVEANEIRSIGRASSKDQILGTTDIRFDGRGRRILPAAAAAANLDMRPVGCTTGKQFVRGVTVSPVGSVTLTKGTC